MGAHDSRGGIPSPHFLTGPSAAPGLSCNSQASPWSWWLVWNCFGWACQGLLAPLPSLNTSPGAVPGRLTEAFLPARPCCRHWESLKYGSVTLVGEFFPLLHQAKHDSGALGCAITATGPSGDPRLRSHCQAHCLICYSVAGSKPYEAPWLCHHC